jgi:acyl carrier protein
MSVAQQSALEREVADLIVETLNLQDTHPEEIDPEMALFGEGLGLDSIDALELSVVIGQRYGVQIKADDADNPNIFASLRSLSDHVGRYRSR